MLIQNFCISTKIVVLQKDTKESDSATIELDSEEAKPKATTFDNILLSPEQEKQNDSASVLLKNIGNDRTLNTVVIMNDDLGKGEKI